MARTIIVDEIKKDEAATAMSVDGVAKSWCNLNGTGTIAVRDSLNVSSITDNGTADTTINFSSAFANADRCTNCNSVRSAANVPQIASQKSQTAPTTNAVEVNSIEYDATTSDPLFFMVTTFGDLA